MNPKYLGDSYDVVKRFFCEVLRRLGYTVYIDPMFTGEWSGQEVAFYRFLGVQPHKLNTASASPTALFLDPDTGVNQKGGPRHVSYEGLAAEAKRFDVVFAFDQGFSRSGLPGPQLNAKLAALLALGCSAFYYDSHARFIFTARDREKLQRLRAEIVAQGLPNSRLVEARSQIIRSVGLDSRTSAVAWSKSSKKGTSKKCNQS